MPFKNPLPQTVWADNCLAFKPFIDLLSADQLFLKFLGVKFKANGVPFIFSFVENTYLLLNLNLK